MTIRDLILEDRPLIYWDGSYPRTEANLGATIPDRSGTGRHGTMNDMLATGIPVRGPVAGSRTGWQWDASTARYVHRAYDSAIDSDTITCEVFASLEDTVSRKLWNRDNDASLQWNMQTDTSGRMLFVMRTSEFGSFISATSTTVIGGAAAPRHLFHLVATWNPFATGPNAGGGRVFVNGREEAYNSAGNLLMKGSSGGIRLGLALDGRSPWRGLTAHAAFYGRALSAQRIRAHSDALFDAFYGVDPARRATTRRLR